MFRNSNKGTSPRSMRCWWQRTWNYWSRVRLKPNWLLTTPAFHWRWSLLEGTKGWLSFRTWQSVGAYQAGSSPGIYSSARRERKLAWVVDDIVLGSVRLKLLVPWFSDKETEFLQTKNVLCWYALYCACSVNVRLPEWWWTKCMLCACQSGGVRSVCCYLLVYKDPFISIQCCF